MSSTELKRAAEGYPLNPMQLRFAEEFAKTPDNASAAALRAGYKESACRKVGSVLSRDPRVIALVGDATEKARKRIGITKERVLQELWQIATANPQDAIQVDENGRQHIDLRLLSKDQAAAYEVSATTVSGGRTVASVSVKGPKASDRIAALVKIGQHLGMFKEQVEVSGKFSLESLVTQSLHPILDTEEVRPILEQAASVVKSVVEANPALLEDNSDSDSDSGQTE